LPGLTSWAWSLKVCFKLWAFVGMEMHRAVNWIME
jgi:hypothetical protein